MVEKRDLPILFLVAAFAFGSEHTLMIIVFLMAGETVCGGRFVALVRVAVLARGIGVFPEERELRLVVVE